MAGLLRNFRVYFLGGGSARISLLHRTATRLYRNGHRRLAMIVFRKIERDYGCYISPRAHIGRGVKFFHPNGIVIGQGVRIGDNVKIYQQVTFGGARVGDQEAGRYPQVGSGTVVFAGAKIIGAITVGENCIIGANAVVTRDVPDFHIAAGIPAVARPRRQE